MLLASLLRLESGEGVGGGGPLYKKKESHITGRRGHIAIRAGLSYRVNKNVKKTLPNNPPPKGKKGVKSRTTNAIGERKKGELKQRKNHEKNAHSAGGHGGLRAG